MKIPIDQELISVIKENQPVMWFPPEEHHFLIPIWYAKDPERRFVFGLEHANNGFQAVPDNTLSNLREWLKKNRPEIFL